MTSPFRNRHICISSRVYEALYALSDIQGTSCADELADLMLGKTLEKEHDLDWLIGRTKKDKDIRKEDYRKRIEDKQKDQLQ